MIDRVTSELNAWQSAQEHYDYKFCDGCGFANYMCKCELAYQCCVFGCDEVAVVHEDCEGGACEAEDAEVHWCEAHVG